MFCNTCGARNEETSNFCAACGRSLDDAKAAVRGAARQPPSTPPSQNFGANVPPAETTGRPTQPASVYRNSGAKRSERGCLSAVCGTAALGILIMLFCTHPSPDAGLFWTTVMAVLTYLSWRYAPKG